MFAVKLSHTLLWTQLFAANSARADISIDLSVAEGLDTTLLLEEFAAPGICLMKDLCK